MSEVKIPVLLSVDKANYRSFVNSLKKTMADLGFNGKTVNAKLDSTYLGEGREGNTLKSKVEEIFYKNEDNNPNYILVNEMVDINSKTGRWVVFNVSKEVAETFSRVAKNVEIKIELLDISQNVITDQTIKVKMPYNTDDRYTDLFGFDGTDKHRNGKTMSIGFLAPYFKQWFDVSDGSGHSIFGKVGADKVKLFVTFNLSNEELKEVKSIKAVVLNVK